ncbi:MAG: M1 family metallopeptidase [Flavobacteriales bacterium]|nr:M1 family metallopeptidase [Flavobacteriales bacterium]
MKLITIIILLLCVFGVKAQKGYFQQEVNTSIEVRLDDSNHFLYAHETIEYINNSSDVLNKVYIHVWPNAYKDNFSAMANQLDENGEIDFHFADAIDRGFIDSLDFKFDGLSILYTYYEGNRDILEFKLRKPIQPGDTVIIETPFRVKIPKGIFSRLGHIGESYQITQWFPKPAVYDLNGWHPLPYLSQGEFYSEYGSYDVKITLPRNYVVGATGDLVDGEEELAFLDANFKETEKMIKDKSVPRNKLGYPIVKEIISDTIYKTLHYHQENVHDFAWFADKRYHVLKGEVILPHSERKVTTWAMFTNNEFDLWTRSIEYLNDATYYYSLWTGDYPYNHVTAVDGSISAGGGMEYPNVTVIGESNTALGLEQVIVHEVGHNWFYGILGTNERVNAWMDEGLNTFMENRYTENKYPDSKMDFGVPSRLLRIMGLDDFGPRGIYDLGYIYNARRNYDQPIQTESGKFTSMNYGAIVYGKTGIGFDYLLAYLGDELYDSCMQAYFDQWKFKHPQPNDLREVFEEVSKKDLSWLFDDYIKTTKKMDYSMSKIKVQGDSAYITINNPGGIAAPLSITGLDEGVATNTLWYDGFKGKKTLVMPYKRENEYLIDLAKDMPTVQRKDDEIATSGILRTMDPIKFKFLGGYEQDDVNHVYFSPIMGWNSQDRYMLGVSFYNTSVPEKKVEWMLSPMYAFRTNTATGIGDIKWNNNFNKGPFRKVVLGYNFKTFSSETSIGAYDPDLTALVNDLDPEIPKRENWLRNELNLNVELKSGLRNARHNLQFRGVMIHENISILENDITKAFTAAYQIKNRQILKPASLKIDFVGLSSEQFGTFSGVSLEAKVRKNYNTDLKGFEFRFFSGYTISRDPIFYTSRYNWSLTGQTGLNDYLFDHTLIGRYQNYPNMMSQQNTETQGNFKTNTKSRIGSTDKWVAAMNFKIEAPFRFPVGVFADAGIYPLTTVTQNGISESVDFLYDAGIYLPIVRDKFEVYIPLIYSDRIQSQLDYQGVNFLQRIRFTLRFDELNPFKIIREIKP